MKIMAFILTALLAVAALTGCAVKDASPSTPATENDAPETSQETPDDASETTGQEGAATPSDAVLGLNPGNIAPDFELKHRDGTTSMLSDHYDKVVFVNFWATWCGPCVREMPHIQKIHENYGDEVYVVAVNISDSEEDTDKFISDSGYTFDVAIDTQDAPYLYQIDSIPMTYVILPNGIVSSYNLGSMTYEEMKTMVERVLK